MLTNFYKAAMHATLCFGVTMTALNFTDYNYIGMLVNIFTLALVVVGFKALNKYFNY